MNGSVSASKPLFGPQRNRTRNIEATRKRRKDPQKGPTSRASLRRNESPAPKESINKAEVV